MDFYSKPIPKPIDRRTRIDMTAFYICQGHPISAVVEILKREHGITDISRDTPYQDLAMATSWGWLTYNPSAELDLTNRLRERYPNLSEVHVPSAGERMTTVTEAAQMVCRIVETTARKRAREQAIDWELKDKAEVEPLSGPRSKGATSVSRDDPNPEPMIVNVKMGFSGGRMMQILSMELKLRLSRMVEDLERELKEEVFDAKQKAGQGDEVQEKSSLFRRRFRVMLRLTVTNLVSGFDIRPQTNPISFLTLMLNEEPLRSRSTFKCFNSSPFVEIGKRSVALEAATELRKFFTEKGLDIVLTGAGSIDDVHSTFSRYYQTDGEKRNLLKSKGVKGDLLWLPIMDKEPFEFGSLRGEQKKTLHYRPMTLIDLHEVASHIRDRDGKVVLVLGPCGRCHMEKSQVLRAVLDQEAPIVTHLVVDRHSAKATLDSPEEGS
tara:strand:- start:2449 stop:3759 length:1311 start_codon:yes stop_codon:yes gene_type:complete